MTRSSVDDSTRPIGMGLVTLARRWRKVLDAAMSELDLTDASWPPLVYLAQAGGGLTQRELADVIGIEGSSLVRLIDKHVEAGLIERHADPNDRRAWRLQLTTEGLAMVRRVRRVLDRVEGAMLAGVSEQDLAVAGAALSTISANIASIEAGS